jgi:hypothetical protein
MGAGLGTGQKAKSNSQVLVDQLSEFLTKSVQSCSSMDTSVQRLEIRGSNLEVSDISQEQITKVNMQCLQKKENIASIQQEIANSIKAAAAASGEALTSILNTTSANVDSVIKNSVSQVVNEESISTLVGGSNNTQDILIDATGANISNLKQKQTIEMVRSNAQNMVSQIDVLQKVSSAIDNKTEAESSLVTTLFGNFTFMIIIIVVTFIIIAGIIVWKYGTAILPGGGGGDQPLVFVQGGPYPDEIDDEEDEVTGGGILDTLKNNAAQAAGILTTSAMQTANAVGQLGRNTLEEVTKESRGMAHNLIDQAQSLVNVAANQAQGAVNMAASQAHGLVS